MSSVELVKKNDLLLPGGEVKRASGHRPEMAYHQGHGIFLAEPRGAEGSRRDSDGVELIKKAGYGGQPEVGLGVSLVTEARGQPPR